ncbi:hypothetical protein QNA08_12915 [Chelatococcus sp. SYSU_G07232]|uniref:Class I SAM-dependent methyltransferase n=1 Tax=Chelatococcus albus TaxID=3047466 RepID=A0ABT7AIE0_9HYPH|nr:hypothetical protein [Chelatococcus sp. SYSU_G07232]MDJ1159139.1 hypothetical protein [Chelatococcus sp. SYSU_G07232]
MGPNAGQAMHKDGRGRGTEGYAEEADRLAMQHESIAFAGLHRPFEHLLPRPPVDVLDIGAGTERCMFDVALAEIRRLAADLGLGVELGRGQTDARGRADVTWSFLALRR